MDSEEMRQYLQNKVCIVITVHSSLTSLTNPKKEFDNARMARYALLLSEYDILIAHRAGEELITPDMLSRAELLEDKEEIKKLFAQAVGDEAQLAMQFRELKRTITKQGNTARTPPQNGNGS